MTTKHTVTGDFMDTIREHFFTDAAEPEPEPEFAPGITVEDVLDMGFEEFGERRAAMGIRHQASNVFQADTSDPGGLPDYRNPMHVAPEPTELEQAQADRPAASVNSSDFMGVRAVNPRSAMSPWRAV